MYLLYTLGFSLFRRFIRHIMLPVIVLTYKFYLNKIGPKISESFLIRDLEMNSTLRNAAFGTDSDETVV